MHEVKVWLAQRRAAPKRWTSGLLLRGRSRAGMVAALDRARALFGLKIKAAWTLSAFRGDRV